jgi:hypothetical protein
MSDLEKACSLVGRFQYHFGRLEQKIDQAVIGLLDLDERTARIVTGSVDFARKVNLVRTSAYEQASTAENKEFADKTCDRVFKVNNARQLVIHSSFEPAPDGNVQFKRTVAKDGRVRIADQVWGDKEFSKHNEEMTALEGELDKLIGLIKPMTVPFDWFNPWQDTFYRPIHRYILGHTSGPDTPITLKSRPLKSRF